MREKLDQLREYLSGIIPGGLCVAFSGGVDSAAILAAACRIAEGGKVHAVTVHTPFHPMTEPEQAAALAKELGAVHHVISIGELDSQLLDNPPDRCYLCKKWIFSTLLRYAEDNGLSCLVDGTNADDLREYRPGLRALRELGVRSPLAELGITKSEVREIARSMGVSVAKKPSAPCLATRFPYHTRIDLSVLDKIDGLERLIRSFGIGVTRIRVYGDTLRVEVLPEDFQNILEKREILIKAAKEAGFLYITLDLEGFRSGSMDLPLRMSGELDPV